MSEGAPMSRAMTRARMMGAVAMVVAAGCGNVTPDITTDEACAMEAQEICRKLDTCATFWVQLLYGDKTTCASRLTLSCKNDQMVDGITRTAQDMVACANDAGTAICADLVASKFPAACQVKPGKRAAGA